MPSDVDVPLPSSSSTTKDFFVHDLVLQTSRSSLERMWIDRREIISCAGRCHPKRTIGKIAPEQGSDVREYGNSALTRKTRFTTHIWTMRIIATASSVVIVTLVH